MKNALITGITGQDGSYLTEFLIEKGYIVYGLVRRSSLFNRSRIEHIYEGNHDQLKFVLNFYREKNQYFPENSCVAGCSDSRILIEYS